ncbi:MAG: NUDIX domain-containing protein [Roseivirga sp.]
MDNKLIDKLAWIEIQDGKVLVARSKGKNAFYIPGGKREAGESDAEALIREIQEELTVTVHEQSLEYYGTFSAQAHDKAEGVIVQMTCYQGAYVGRIAASSEIEEVRWLNYSQNDIVAPVDKIIFLDLLEKGLLK